MKRRQRPNTRPAREMGIDDGWLNFLEYLKFDILPLYEAHERTFDHQSINGRMHICRAVIFGEAMGRYFHRQTSLAPSMASLRYAIAFHDSGRRGNGPDLWEGDSADACARYLAGHVVSRTLDPAAIAALIPKAPDAPDAAMSLEGQIVHDADVLDIMRPCSGHGGRGGFRDSELLFPGPDRADGPREQLIDEAWAFIQETERVKEEVRYSEDYLADILKILADTLQGETMLGGYIPTV